MRIPLAAGLALLALAAPARAAIVPGATVDGPSADISGNQAVSVDVAPDGSAAIAYIKNGDVYVSQLAGGAWTAGQRVDNLAAGEAIRPDIAVANGGKIVVAFLEQSMSPSTIRAVVKPAGQPFPSTPAPSIEPGLSGSHVEVELAPGGDGYATFTVGSGATQQVRAAHLSGTTWTPVGGSLGSPDGNLNSVATNLAGDSMHEPRIAVGGDGASAVLAWAEEVNPTEFQVFARRLTGTDKGTAVRADLDSLDGAQASKQADQLDVSSDAAGNAWVSFRDNFVYGMTNRGHAILRRFVGSAFEPPQVADTLGNPPPESIEFPKVDVNASGKGLVGMYRQLTFGTQAAALDGTAWAPLGDINAAANPAPAFTVPAIAGSGNGVVAWLGPDGLVRARVRGNGALAPELLLSQDGAGASNTSSLQAAADQQSFAVVAFPQGPANNGRIVAAVVDLPAPPGGPGPGPGTGTADTIAPVVGSLRLSRRTFAVGAARTPVAARIHKGTTISYSLSEAASVRFRIERALPGRRAGGRCRKPTKRLRKKRRCTRYATAGTLRRGGARGANRLAFSGRIGRKPLKRGSHRLTVTATDAAGNASSPRRAKFKIVRAPNRR